MMVGCTLLHLMQEGLNINPGVFPRMSLIGCNQGKNIESERIYFIFATAPRTLLLQPL